MNENEKQWTDAGKLIGANKNSDTDWTLYFENAIEVKITPELINYFYNHASKIVASSPAL